MEYQKWSVWWIKFARNTIERNLTLLCLTNSRCCARHLPISKFLRSLRVEFLINTIYINSDNTYLWTIDKVTTVRDRLCQRESQPKRKRNQRDFARVKRFQNTCEIHVCTNNRLCRSFFVDRNSCYETRLSSRGRGASREEMVALMASKARREKGERKGMETAEVISD